MSEHITLNVEPRSDSGKGASRRLRHQGKVPAIVYGGKFDPVKISIAHNEIIHELEHETIYTQVVNLKMDGKVQEVILRDLQRHPFKNKILHADFFRIDKDKPIKVVVPIHVLNAEDCVGVKLDGGMMTQMMTDVEIISLPNDLPEHLEIDALELHMGEMLHLTDIPMPKGVEIVALTHVEEGEDVLHSDYNAAVLAVVKPRAEEVIEDEAPEAPDSDEDGEDGEADDGDATEGDASDDD